MERLTLDEAIAHAKEVAEEKYNEGFLCHANPDDGKLDECVKCAREHEQLAEWLTQLKEYQQLEEQDRLIKLPCKMGDVVYRINRGAMKPIIPLRVVEYRFKIVGNCIREKICCSDDFLCKQPSIIYYAEDIGNKVFLTKSEAEAKLKELRGSNEQKKNNT